jgi:hypothetical protein
MQESERKHPDVFTAEEAAMYLHCDSERSLENIRAQFGLVGYPGFGKALRYYRDDLDAVAMKMLGRDPVTKKLVAHGMRMAK